MLSQPRNDLVIDDIETLVPETVYSQETALQICAQIFAKDPEALAFMQRVLPSSGIGKRHSVIRDYLRAPADRVLLAASPDFRPEPSTAARGRIFAGEAPALALQVCRNLLARAPERQAQITHLLTASCTGCEAPGFDVDLVAGLPLAPDVQRVHVGFMGCFAGFSTLKLAHAICGADPDAVVLIVHAELCSLHVHFGPERDELVANGLFADGLAAALVRAAAGPAPLRVAHQLHLVRSSSFLVPNTRADMTWTVGDDGFHMRLSPRVPLLLRRHLPAVFDSLLDRQGLDRQQVRHWAIHPGGPAILDKTREALQIGAEHLQASVEVLRDYGNMSSATLWFVLDRIRRRRDAGWVFACGFGPGLTVEAALLELRAGDGVDMPDMADQTKECA